MIPDDRIDQALHAFRDHDLPDGPPPDVVSRTLAALHRNGPNPAARSLFGRIKTMPSFVRIAAVLLAAAIATGFLTVMNTGRKGPGVAFADALEHVRDARTMTYSSRTGDAAQAFRISRIDPGLTRTELSGEDVMIEDRIKGRSLILNTRRKEAMLIESKPIVAIGQSGDLFDQLRNFRGKPEQDLGERVIGDRTARGFRISAGGWDPVVWVDIKTKLPIRMELKTASNADGMKIIVFDEFVFDTPLDPALFSLTPPEGYKVRVIPVVTDQVVPVERDLVDLLGDYAKRSGGRFPNDLQMPSLLDVLKDIKTTKAGLDDATNAWIAKIGKGVGLVWAMPPDRDSFYLGKGVKLGQADKPIFRYRPLGSKTYRVIYGDLTVKDVDPSQVPK